MGDKVSTIWKIKIDILLFGVTTGYGLDGRRVGIRLPVRSSIFTSPYCPDRLWGLLNLLTYGYRAVFPWVKRQEREANHSRPTSAEVKKTWVYKSSPSTSSWHSAWLGKLKDNLIFIVIIIIIIIIIVMKLLTAYQPKANVNTIK
jgi:hypothetical protein